MANEFIARKGLIVLANGATVTGSLKVSGSTTNTGNISAVGYHISASLMSASTYYGDGSQLTGVTATGLDIDNFGADLTAITVASTDKLPISDNGTEGRINVSQLSTPLAGTGLEANAGTIRIAAAAAGNGLTGGAGSALAVGAGSGITVNTDDVALNTGSAHFVTGSRGTISSANTAGASGINLTYNTSSGVISGSLVNSSITVTAGDGLSGGGATSLGSSTTVSLNTGSAHFEAGVRKEITSSNTTGASGITLNYNQTTGNISASLLNSSLTVNGQAISLGGSGTVTANTTNALTLGSGLTGTSFNGGTAVTTTIDTGSAHFLSGSRAGISVTDTAGASGIDLTYNSGTGVLSGTLVNSAVTVTAGNALTGGGSVSLGSSVTLDVAAGAGISVSGPTADAVNLDTGSAHFTNGVKAKLNADGIYSSSAQVAAVGFATTASNSFTGIQNIDDTTQSTTWTNGALVVDGGVGIAKNLNVSGSVNIQGLLTVVSMSTQYVTSSQYIIGDNRIILNDDDNARFAGMSIYDSGSSAATASIYWDSLNHKFLYENISGEPYNSAIFIAGPKNTGTLGSEVGLTDFRVPVAHGSDHIDSRPNSSSIRVDFPTRLTHIEAGLQVTGSISSSVGFSGDGSQLTGIVTNLNVSGSTSGNGTVSLKTQSLIVSGTNGLTSTVSGQTVTISGSDATTTSKGVASFNSTNFSVTNGAVSSANININGTNVTLGGTRNITLSEITAQGATTTTQTTFSGGVVVGGALISGSSNTSAAGASVVVAQFATGSYDAAHFDYVLKDGTNLRTGTVMTVWRAGTTSVEYTDTSTNDIGDTVQATFDADTTAGNIRLKLSATSGTWTVKTSVRAF